MANHESGGGVDYFELRRKHLEYKKKAAPQPETVEDTAPPPVREEDAPFMRPAPPAEDVDMADVPEEEIPTEEIPAADFPEQDAHAAYARAENEEETFAEDEGDDYGGNPFHSFILAFNKIRDKIAARRAQSAHGEVLDDSDDGYEDEEPQEERRGPFRFFRRHEEEPEEYEPEDDDPEADAPDEAPAEEIPEEAPTGDAPDSDAPIEDAVNDIPVEPFDSEMIDMPEQVVPVEQASTAHDADAAYDDYDEDEEDDRPHGDGFKRFVNLFIVREDRIEDEPIDAGDYEVEDPKAHVKIQEYDDSLFTKPREHGASEEEQEPMADQENNKVNMTDIMADGLNDGTLSRRERRLLKERQEALKRAEEAQTPDEDATIDEPTREYKPVARPQTQDEPESAAEPIPSLFDEDEGARRKSARRDDYDDEDDYETPKSRKRAKRDDYDDEDDYETPKSRKRAKRDDYDDEDDEEPKSRKRAKRDDYDDEDDYEEPRSRKRAKRDDYGDEDDDYEPRRGNRSAAYDDDYDEYDDYDEAPSFGHYVLGFFKLLIAVVLVLAVALFGLYFADQAVPGGVGAYAWLREKAPVIDKLLPPGSEDTNSAVDMLDLDTSSPDESQAPTATDDSQAPSATDDTQTPGATDAGTVG